MLSSFSTRMITKTSLITQRHVVTKPSFNIHRHMATKLSPIVNRHALGGTILSRSFSAVKNHYLTLPIFYVNGQPHIGHLYTAVMGDSMRRWFDLKGEKAFLMVGTDEHGIKVQEACERSTFGKDYQGFSDSISSEFKRLFDDFDIQYDAYMRTSSSEHQANVQRIWTQLEEAGHIYLGKHEGWYCVADECFVPQSQVSKKEDNPEEYEVTTTGQPVVWVSEENYKFRLSAFREPLLQWLESNPEAIQPKARWNEVVSFLQTDLNDISVSRLRENVEWAIPVPNNPDHVIYVWLDALSVYLTACGYGTEKFNQSKDNLERIASWPATHQFIGKDILRFHTVYWPAFLMAIGQKPPNQVVAHAHWTVNGRKMSKSIGNVISPDELLKKYTVDCVRYFLLRNGGLINDANYSDEELVKRLNSDLADKLGNMFMRPLSNNLLAEGRIIPNVDLLTLEKECKLKESHLIQMQETKDMVKAVTLHYDECQLGLALQAIQKNVRALNVYFDQMKPWEINKTDKSECDIVIALTIESMRISITLLQPVIPEASECMLSALCVPEEHRMLDSCVFGKGGNYNVKLEKVKKIPFKKLVLEVST